MDIQVTEEEKTKKPLGVCELCSQSYGCGVLMTALKILEKEALAAGDTYSHEVFLTFKHHIEQYGFHFPDAKTECWLHDKRSVVQDLVSEASRLIAELRKRGEST